ncbi:hypothetical protein LS71_003805 [Helicobacter jaachi]|uniref:Periplasmic protein n=1 Tax=Helicobacter jaachi TaxID=1677920 RepID=A0A4U8TA76_9HELI|nr:hypothetical protein [Helicobacter jaachi]TLD96741.1 hypothetical protein LS71_003805 [Helicobacter jaachi]
MKAFYLALILCIAFVSNALAKSYIISPLPLPQQEVLNVSTDKCSNSCLLDFFTQGQVFSFIAFFDTHTDNVELRAKLAAVLNDMGIFEQMLPSTLQSGANIKLALLMPKKIIGRYSASSIDTILAYLMARGNDFVFEIFDTGDESGANLNKTYKKIAAAHYDFVVAILTPNGAQEFVKLDISLPTYLPTINKKQILSHSIPQNLIFGGIDYEAQIELLLSLAGNKDIVAYNDSSYLGRSLGEMLRKKTNRIVLEEVIDSQSATTFAQKLASHEPKIADNVIFFNTPVIKTGLMASQLALSKKSPDKLLSTQINFNPALLLLIQKDDRKNLFITNVINNKNAHLVEYASLLGGDLRYDWVNYSTAIGVEQLISAYISQNKRFFDERVKDSQIEYVNRIYKSNAKNFYEQR